MISVGVAVSATKMLDPGLSGVTKPEPVLFEIVRFVARFPKQYRKPASDFIANVISQAQSRFSFGTRISALKIVR